MEKKFRITVENTVYTVTVEDLDLTAEAAAASPAPQIVAVAPAPAPAPVAVVADNAPRQVTCRLGGVIQSIEVTVGQMVNTGDKVMIVEAMKMKTPMIATCSGKVLSIVVTVGEKVETGQVLLTIG